MTPAELAKHYCRFYADGILANNAPPGAHKLHASIKGSDRQALLWKALDVIANKRPVPKVTDAELHTWMMTYPRAVELVADHLDRNKNKVKFWFGVSEAWRAEFLAMTDIVHKHLIKEGVE